MTGFADVFDVPTVDFHRGRYKRPLVMQLDGTEAEYLRPSQIGSHAKDSEGLIRWSTRRAARAAALAAGWLRMRIATEDDGSVLDQLINDAIRQAATEPDAADRGTAWHTAVETARQRRSGDAERLANRARVLADAGLVELPEYRERLVVDDLRQTAGRWDGLVLCPRGFEVDLGGKVVNLSGALVVADDKTGRSQLRWGKRGGVSGGESTSVQLTAYSRSVLYDPGTHVRTRVPGISQDAGLIIHTDLDARRTRLVWVELSEARLISCLVLARSRTNLVVGGDSWTTSPISPAKTSSPD